MGDSGKDQLGPCLWKFFGSYETLCTRKRVCCNHPNHLILKVDVSRQGTMKVELAESRLRSEKHCLS
jgi:hypothetical protein